MRKSIKICLLIIILMVILVLSPQGKASIKAVLFIPQILPDIPVKPLEYLSGTPIRQEIVFTSSVGISEGDIYLPSGDGVHPGVVFFMGIVPPERDEERIVALAEGLARTGMVVLIPWLDTQTHNRLMADDIEILVDGFEYLQNHERTDRTRVGMGGICTGASMAVVAAQSSRINEEVDFINSFAGYYNAFDLVKATSSATKFQSGTSADWAPDKLTKNMVTTHLIEGAEVDDREILMEILNSGIWNQTQFESLSESGRSVLTLITGPNLSEAQEAINGLNNKTVTFLEAISPSTNISMLKADVLLMHDLHDRLVPAEESRRFAEGVRKHGVEVYHTEFSLFQDAVQVHTNEANETSTIHFIKEAFKLYKHMYRIMRLSS